MQLTNEITYYQLNYLIISFEIQCAFSCHSIECLIHLININSLANDSNVFLTIKTSVYQRRYQKGKHNPQIDAGQTTQWQKEKDKQRSKKHRHKTKDRVTRTQQ